MVKGPNTPTPALDGSWSSSAASVQDIEQQSARDLRACYASLHWAQPLLVRDSLE